MTKVLVLYYSAYGHIEKMAYTLLRDMVLAHPTIAEGLGDLFAVPLTDPAPHRHTQEDL